jgi:hypothetical protein
MTDQSNIAARDSGPALAERPISTGKRWAILVGFAVVVFGVAASVNHRGVQQDEPPSAAATTQPAPPSTNAVLPQNAPATKSGG